MNPGLLLICALVLVGLYVAAEIAVQDWRADRHTRACTRTWPALFETQRRADPTRAVQLRVRCGGQTQHYWREN